MVHTTNAHTVVYTVEFAFFFLDERKKEFKSFFHNAHGGLQPKFCPPFKPLNLDPSI